MGRSFGELLDWHLVQWGTRPVHSKEKKGKSWPLWRFAAAAYGKSTNGKKGDEFETESKNLARWRQGKTHPRRDQSKRILETLFDDNIEFMDWKQDLESSLLRPRELSPLLRDSQNGILISANDSSPIYAALSGTTLPSSDIPYNEPIDLTPEGDRWLERNTPNNQSKGAVIAQAVHALGLRRELLENFARSFRCESLDVSDDSLQKFLEMRVKEYHEMKEVISALREAEAQLGNILSSAEAALDAGRFDEASELLRVAEESYQNSKTMEVIRTQYEIRVLRGQSALFSGNLPDACSHFKTAVEFFRGFSEDDEAWSRIKLAELIKDYLPQRLGRETVFHARNDQSDIGNYIDLLYREANKDVKALNFLAPALAHFPPNTEGWAKARLSFGFIVTDAVEGSEPNILMKSRAIHYLRQAEGFFQIQGNTEDALISRFLIGENLEKQLDRKVCNGKGKSFLSIANCAETLWEETVRRFENTYPIGWLFSISQLQSILCLKVELDAGISSKRALARALEITREVYRNREISWDDSSWYSILSNYVRIAKLGERISQVDHAPPILVEVSNQIEEENRFLREKMARGLMPELPKGWLYRLDLLRDTIKRE